MTKTRPLLWLAAPHATATLAEKFAVIDATRKALKLGWMPLWLPGALTPALDDIDPEQRAIALDCCASVIPRCDAFLLVCPRLTDGVQKDIAAWQHGAAIYFEDQEAEKPSFKWPVLPSVAEWKERASKRARRHA